MASAGARSLSCLDLSRHVSKDFGGTRSRKIARMSVHAVCSQKPRNARFSSPAAARTSDREEMRLRRGGTASAMPSWWPFGEKEQVDKEGNPLLMVEVEKILGVRFKKDDLDRVIGLEYKLKWSDGAPDSWEPAQNVAEDLLRDFEEAWWTAAKNVDDFGLRECLSYGEEVLINSIDKEGRTALHYACGRGNERCTATLLEFGAEVNAGDKDGFTPLHIAAGYMYTNTVRTLVKAGADPEKKDKANRSPLDLIMDLKRRLPESSPEYWTRRNQLEDVCLTLMQVVYEEVPVSKVLDKRRVKASTGVVVTEDTVIGPNDIVEEQYLVRWADSNNPEDDEWVLKESVAEDLVADWESGLEHCDAEKLLEKSLIDGQIHYLVQWSDGATPSWEPMYHISDYMLRNFEDGEPIPVPKPIEDPPAKELQAVEKQ